MMAFDFSNIIARITFNRSYNFPFSQGISQFVSRFLSFCIFLQRRIQESFSLVFSIHRLTMFSYFFSIFRVIFHFLSAPFSFVLIFSISIFSIPIQCLFNLFFSCFEVIFSSVIYFFHKESPIFITKYNIFIHDFKTGFLNKALMPTPSF